MNARCRARALLVGLALGASACAAGGAGTVTVIPTRPGVARARGATPAPAPAADPGYLHHLSGDAADRVVEAAGGVALLGGGSELVEAFRWMIEHASGGDLLVLRASGGFELEAWIQRLGGLDSAETLVITRRAGADAPFVAERIAGAEVVFLAGGDQSSYERLFAGSGLARALEARLRARPLVLGGTSAGLAVLGAVDYTAEHGSVSSGAALSDPFDGDITLRRDFLVAPGLEHVVTDSHFARRDRMGRLLAFLARVVDAGWLATPRGIGVDEGAALVMEPSGVAYARGGPVWILEPSRSPGACERGRPLTLEHVTVHRVAPGGAFQLRSGSALGGTRSYSVSVKRGRLVGDAGEDPYDGPR